MVRANFDEVLDCFPDNYFDFIYIDAYAHNGQEGGSILHSWWPKLKPGGVFAGHDYDPEWPVTVQVVDQFCSSNKLDLNIIPGIKDVSQIPREYHGACEQYASWYCNKPI